MQISINIITIIEIIGFIQGIFFVSILLLVNRFKDKSTTFLALFVLAYSFNYVTDIIDYLNLFGHSRRNIQKVG